MLQQVPAVLGPLCWWSKISISVLSIQDDALWPVGRRPTARSKLHCVLYFPKCMPLIAFLFTPLKAWWLLHTRRLKPDIIRNILFVCLFVSPSQKIVRSLGKGYSFLDNKGWFLRALFFETGFWYVAQGNCKLLGSIISLLQPSR